MVDRILGTGAGVRGAFARTAAGGVVRRTRAVLGGFGLAAVALFGLGADGCGGSGLRPGEVGTATCIACHDGRSASDQREHFQGPHKSISCETCHGPGLQHVRNGGRLGLFIDNPGRLPFDKRHTACTDCHADTMTPGGDSVSGFLQSAHFGAGAATCTDCHNVHKQGGMVISATSPARFGSENYALLCGECHEGSVAGFAASTHAQLDVATCASCHNMHKGDMFRANPADNRLCLQCHQSSQLGFQTDADVDFHTGTFHPVDPAGSGASRCTSCHLPPLDAGGDAEHDHSLFTIPPIATNDAVAQGVSPAPPNSCAGVTGCHDPGAPGSGPAYDPADLENNEYLQTLYEMLGARP